MVTVVTGASGLLGANLVRALLADGRTVRALVHRDTRALKDLEVERVSGDILDPSSLRKAFDGAETVFHCAAKVSISRSGKGVLTDVNVLGTRNVAHACLDSGVGRLVHISSCHALSEFPADRPITERNGLCRESEKPLPYSLSKAAGEREVLAAAADGLPAVILNPSALVGPHDHGPSYIGETVRDLAASRLPALICGAYDYVDVRDVAAAAIEAGRRGRPGERYLVGGHRLTFRELADVIAEVGGAPAPRWTCPMWMARGLAPFPALWSRITGRRPKFTGASLRVVRGNSVFDCSKAAAELGHRPRPIRETLRDAIAWHNDAGVLK